MNRADVEEFFKTLLLGDFEEHQNAAAQIVGGLIALIPILGQVMAGRDITGTLFNINKRGGFKNAAPAQLVNLGFAAFGAIPEAGPVFKTVFKPLWKERQLAKGAVHGGMAAIERLLGLGKGGAITWIRKELLGKWAMHTQQMVAATLTAMDACIGLLDFVATASGWQGWLVPDVIQELAKQLLPGMKKMRGEVTEPLNRASAEIKHFLEDLLGERTAAVLMAVGSNVVAASAVPATRTRGGHNAADPHTTGKVKPRQHEEHVQNVPKADAKKASGPSHAAVQATSKAFRELARLEKGLVGEHMADFHELKRLRGNWPHDKSSGAWSPDKVRKLNADRRPVNLTLADLPKMKEVGIDAVWEHNGHYTVTEAKARESIFAVVATVKSLTNKGLVPPTVRSLSADLQNLWLILSTNNKDVVGQGAPLVQMSDRWVVDRAGREGLPSQALLAVQSDAAARRVLLVTLESAGATDHGIALAQLHTASGASDIHAHREHGICREWEAADIDKIVVACRNAHDAKQAARTPKPAKPTKPAKLAK